MKTAITSVIMAVLLVFGYFDPAAQGGSFQVVNQWLEGPVFSVTGTAGHIALYGNGGILEIADISDPSAPVLLSELKLGSVISDIVVNDSTAFVALDEIGVQIIDIHELSSPVLKGLLQSSSYDGKILINGILLYYTDNAHRLRIADISDLDNPAELSVISLSSWGREIALDGNYLFLASGWDGMYTVDISNPYMPVEAGQLTVSYISDVLLVDNYAYLAAYDSMFIVDISDPLLPVLLKRYELGGYKERLAYQNNNLFLLDIYGKFQVMNITNRTNPVEISTLNTQGVQLGFALEGDMALIANSTDGLLILDISDPTDMEIVGNKQAGSYIYDVEARNDLVYLAAGENGVMVMNMEGPGGPVVLGSYPTTQSAIAITVQNSMAYFVDLSGEFYILDVSNPTAIHEIGYLELEEGTSWDVIVDGGYAYVAQGTAGVAIIDISDPAHPLLLSTAAPLVGKVYGVFKEDNIVYMASDMGLGFIDVSSPSMPTPAGYLSLPQNVYDVEVRNGIAYIANSYNDFITVDVSELSSPEVLGHVYTTGNSRSVKLHDQLAFVGADWGGLYVVDISDPSDPQKLGRFNSGGKVYGVEYRDGLIYIADYDCGVGVLEFVTTAVNEAAADEKGFITAYPVPASSMITLTFDMPSETLPGVIVYDQVGRAVRKLSVERVDEDSYMATWNGKTDSGAYATSGQYFVIVSGANNMVRTTEVMLYRE